MDKVILRNLRGIGKLEFELPGEGVWLLTGLNGSGKTSLFAALYRIRFGNAFQRFFKTSSNEDRVDSYSSAEVEYCLEGESVVYKYGGQRWRANPKSKSKLLDKSRYPSVQFVEASGERVEPYPDEITARRIRDPNDGIRTLMSDVLGDPKWDNLKYVNTRRGRGSKAFLLPVREGNRTKYFSERNFSLGELCILRLAQRLSSIARESLVLVDEVEMALHPQAQVRLLRAIIQIAEDRNLTVIFSTHSSTLVRSAARRSLILLHSGRAGIIEVVRDAYPATILGEIAFGDELVVDFVFYVEDEEAKSMLEQIIALYFKVLQSDGVYRPQYRILPVGGYPQVLSMLHNSASVFPSYVKRVAFLDEDARRHVSAEPSVYFLPATPELGLVQWLESMRDQGAGALREINGCVDGVTLQFHEYMSLPQYNTLSSNNDRARAKKRLDFLVQKAEEVSGRGGPLVRSRLYALCCRSLFAGQNMDVRALLGPVFNMR